MKRILIFVLVLGLAHGVHARELGDEAYGVLMTSFMYDASYPLNARVAGERTQEGIKFEKVVLDSFNGGVVAGLLALPASGEGPFPVVLLLHGLTDNKESWFEDGFSHGLLITRGLLAKGVAVMALDAQFHGDRSVYNDYIDPGEMVFKHGWGVRYKDLLTQTTIDYRRAIDYLGTRGEIDVNRVGLLGYSMGGHTTFLLAASEPRVKAVVACVVPETPNLLYEASTFVRGLDQTPLLMMMARKDQFYTVESAQRLFDSVPGPDKTLQFFDSGHSLPVEYVQQAVDWLGRKL